MNVIPLFPDKSARETASASVSNARKSTLSEKDAVDIWIARWLRIRRKDILQRYDCDPRRLYEVWEGVKHPASRAKALIRFQAEYPNLMDRVDFGGHRRIPRNERHPDQLSLFEDERA